MKIRDFKLKWFLSDLVVTFTEVKARRILFFIINKMTLIFKIRFHFFDFLMSQFYSIKILKKIFHFTGILEYIRNPPTYIYDVLRRFA